MFYIIGRKSDKKIVETVSINNEVSLPTYLTNVAINHGGVASDYSVLALDNNNEDVKTIYAGSDYTVTWVDDSIVGVDFSIELNRKLFMIKTLDPSNPSVIKEYIKGDGTDSILIKIRTCFADGITLDSSINATTLLPVKTPDNRIIYFKVVITNGVAADLLFTAKLEGVWMPATKNITVGTETMRLKSDNGEGATKTINVLMNI